jgi:hypothetical protein
MKKWGSSALYSGVKTIAEPRSSAGNFHGFCNHISFVMKSVILFRDLELHFYFPTHLFASSVLSLLLLYIINNEILTFANTRKYCINLHNMSCFKKCFLVFARENTFFRLQGFGENLKLVTRVQQMLRLQGPQLSISIATELPAPPPPNKNRTSET